MQAAQGERRYGGPSAETPAVAAPSVHFSHVADDAGQPISCRVQLDGTEDTVIVHRSSIRPISEVET